MPKVSAKRQITLPADQCRLVGIEPGDECVSFVADGRITIVRQEPGSARGCLGTSRRQSDGFRRGIAAGRDRRKAEPNALIAIDTIVLLRYLLRDDGAG